MPSLNLQSAPRLLQRYHCTTIPRASSLTQRAFLTRQCSCAGRLSVKQCLFAIHPQLLHARCCATRRIFGMQLERCFPNLVFQHSREAERGGDQKVHVPNSISRRIMQGNTLRTSPILPPPHTCKRRAHAFPNLLPDAQTFCTSSSLLRGAGRAEMRFCSCAP